jgi:hypothetical protein
LEDGTFGFYLRAHATCSQIQDEIMEPVEHLCPRCKSSVDDNSPFCPTCEAAQVIAAPKEYARSPVTVMVESTQPFFNAGTFPKSIGNRDAKAELRAAFYAAIVGSLLSLVQPGGSFVIALPVAGFLSVVLFRRFNLKNELPPRTGFRLGAICGLFAFGLLMIIIAAGTLAFHSEADTHAQVIQVIQQAQARNPDPQARPVFAYFMTSQGMAVMMVFGFIFMAVLFVLLSGVGGAISASLLRRKAPPGQ